VVRWLYFDLREEIDARWSVTVWEQIIGRWLRQLRLTWLQPRPCRPKKDPEAEEAFKLRARIASQPALQKCPIARRRFLTEQRAPLLLEFLSRDGLQADQPANDFRGRDPRYHPGCR
jgi:hypothetical protein